MKNIKEVSSKDVALYAGSNLHLNEIYNSFKDGKKFVFSLKALVFGPYWLAYNKLYLPLILFLILLAVGAQTGMLAIAALAWPIAALFGNTALMLKIAGYIKKVRARISDEDAAVKALTDRHSTSKLAVVGLLAISMAVSFVQDNATIDVRTADLTNNKEVSYSSTAQGQFVKTPLFSINVQSVKVQNSVAAQYMNHTAAEGATLALVQYSYKNISEKPVSAMKLSLHLSDAKKSKYDESIECGMVVASAGLASNKLEMVNPNVNNSDVACFEVPTTFNKNDWSLLVSADKNVLIPIK